MMLLLRKKEAKMSLNKHALLLPLNWVKRTRSHQKVRGIQSSVSLKQALSKKISDMIMGQVLERNGG